MTDYPASKKSSKKPVWKEQERARKWRGIFAIFLVIFLVFFIANGILRAFSLKNSLTSSKWDGRSPFAIALAATPVSVLVFNSELSKIVVLVNAYTAAGDTAERKKLPAVMSREIGVNIPSYIVFNNLQTIDKVSLEKEFSEFKSFKTPIKIITGGSGSTRETNITRIDLLRLWWQAKDISTNSLKIIDLGQFQEGDREAVHQQIDEYFMVKDIAGGNVKVEIRNSSVVPGAGRLAEEIATSLGYNVIRVEAGEREQEKCQVAGNDSLAGRYLANVFGCDIVGSLLPGESKLILTLGRDFARRYF